MKTITFYSLMLFVSVLLCGGFTACSDDDDDGGGKEEVKKTGKLDFSFSRGDDLLLLADVEVIFIDTDGKKTTEKVTAFPWKKTVTFDKVPVTAGYKINMTPKSGVELTKDTYKFSKEYKNYFYAFENDLEVTMKSLIDVSSTSTAAKDKVGEYLEKNLSSETYAYKVDADYSCNKAELVFE